MTYSLLLTSSVSSSGFFCLERFCGLGKIAVHINVAGGLSQGESSPASAPPAQGELISLDREDLVRQTMLIVGRRVYARTRDPVSRFEQPIRHNVRPNGELSKY